MSSLDRDPQTVRGSEWQTCRRGIRDSWLDIAFSFWRGRGFPFFRLSRSDREQEFQKLMRRPVVSVADGAFYGSNVGLRLANSFHPQMWSVKVSRYRTPMDVFLDDDLLRCAIERAWRVWPERFGANAASLRRMLKTFPGSASVSNFRPTAARNIIGSLSRDRETILDFSAGYGGRLLGALTLCRNYVGIDPCASQIAGLRGLLVEVRPLSPVFGTAALIQGCAEDVLPTLPPRTFDLVFSSPPYFNWERYSDEPTQSYARYPSYEEWLQGFLRPTIVESHRVLRRRGRLAINVSGRFRRPSAEDVTAIAASTGLQLEYSSLLQLARVPYMHPRSNGPTKVEKLLVWTKP